MQSRRNEEYVTLSPASKLRNQHRYEVGHNSYPVSRRDAVDRSPRVQQRSLSPRSKIDGSRRILLREGRSGPIERRDYSWHLGAGRNENIRSGSPHFVPELRKPHFDEGVMRRKYEYADDIDYDDVKSNRLQHVYGYDHHGEFSRMSKEKDYDRNRIVDIDRHMMVAPKSMPMEDGTIRGLHRVPTDFIPTSNYGKTAEHLQLPSRGMDMSQYEHEKIRHRKPISPDKMPEMEFYKEGEQPLFGSRDDSYAIKPASHSKDFGRSHFKDFAGQSSGVSSSEFLSSHREGMPMSASDEYPRNGVKLTEPMDLSTYSQRSSVGIRNLETGKRIMPSYAHGAYSPDRIEHNDYVYPKSQGLLNDDNMYPSELHRMMPSRSQLDHVQARADFEYGELSRMSIVHSVADKIDPTENSYRNMRNSDTWDHTMPKQAAMENLDTSRILYSTKHSGEYLDSEYNQVEFGRRVSRNSETSHLGITQDHQISHLRSNYGFGRDAGPQFEKERLHDPVMSLYELEMQKFPVKRHRIKEELDIYEPSDKVHKRHCREENVNRHDPRTILPSKQYRPQVYDDEYGSGEEWIEGNLTALHPSRTKRFDQNAYRKAKRTYDGHEHRGDFASEEWLSSQDSLAQSRKHSIRYYKPSVKYLKGHPRSGSLSWHNSHQTDKRSGIQRKHRTWKRSDEYDEDEQSNDHDLSEDWGKMAASEPCEDSEEFKQLVHEAFLEYSKKLNLNSAVRRRYKEQGKAGSLFCIVCGRSASKDFLDTQRLVTHAFMSHKVGLRAQHLGLHKAICILMGWNTYVPCDTQTWIPDILPDTEAWAQKEDLMLWPPLVIIHNISMSNDNPEQQKVIPIEGVEAFIRGKGFAGGKIKVCLGKPADQSVILVKFLGTFTGLGNAERLHKYFAENEHGREEFERKTSNSSNVSEAGIEGDKLEEQLLYGYMGIADDLDRLDFNTKKWITVKSKKDIEDLENAPVKTDDR
ncbi:hypothetical protein JCGZ_01506 [Jatropha curcas]|uniref:XS domain-containing protein n=1 Tax=Jatropha curcas TaxID=180498 RepID=A0A067L967_JATCU|nr:uncharacterized protein LOC105648065 [Jatropha curcas]XP_012089739.1 uncharacterized protein LOC105648065 [Jatropha curcas]XP_012089747.1 uncharacterized protein LOC105648065 [Jatropha curcas]KDP45006.1 hypothetical protein JCGZ_01506 [Jatropha curcas]